MESTYSEPLRVHTAPASAGSPKELRSCYERLKAEVEVALNRFEDSLQRSCGPSPLGCGGGPMPTKTCEWPWPEFVKEAPKLTPKARMGWLRSSMSPLSSRGFLPGSNPASTPRKSWGLRAAGRSDGNEEDQCLVLREAAPAQDRKRIRVPAIVTDLDSPCSFASSGLSINTHITQDLRGHDATLPEVEDQKSECTQLPELEGSVCGIGGCKASANCKPASAWSLEDASTCDISGASGQPGAFAKGTPASSGPAPSTLGSSRALWGMSRRTPSKAKSKLNLSPLSKKKLALVQANQSWLEWLTRSQAYELFSTVLIISNALFIIWETEQRSMEAAQGFSTDNQDLYFSATANIFCLFFMLDLAFRIGAEGSAFLRKRELAWNMMDVLVVLTALAEVSVQWYQRASGSLAAVNARLFLRKFSMLRIVRLLHVVRRTKATWAIKAIKELRVMVLSLTGALKSLIWSVVLLLIVLAVFGVFFTDGAVAFCLKNDAMNLASTEPLRHYFGTLSRSVLSLFKAMAGGEDWAAILDSLGPLNIEYQAFFIAFIAFAILALLNVVTAVFVGAAFQRAQHDRELIVQEQMESKAEFLHTMEQVFFELDTNDSGELNLDEFESYIEDEKIKAFLSTCQLDIDQVKTLFSLLDTDGTGTVDLEEFITGCLRLRGGATSLDMAMLRWQVDSLQKSLGSMQEFLGQPKLLSDRPVSRTIRSRAAPRKRPLSAKTLG
uniref:EF-hand domain-containing protein n=1 Tax=Pyrodinium bahamense TaxID=73915 RepID=A0A7S0AGA6_9DINO